MPEDKQITLLESLISILNAKISNAITLFKYKLNYRSTYKSSLTYKLMDLILDSSKNIN